MSNIFKALERAEQDRNQQSRERAAISLKALDRAEHESLAISPLLVHGTPSVFTPESDPQVVREFLRLKALLLVNSGEGAKTLMVCSSIHGEGASTVVSNLAVALAETASRGVLLVDANLRRPTLQHIFGAEGGLGFSDLMLEKATLSQVIQETVFPNLWLTTCGKSLPFSSKLFGTLRLNDVFWELKDRFDFVLFDGPPIALAPESLVLASKVDKVILVVEAERTPIDVVQEVKEQIERTGGKILGVAFNRRRAHAPKALIP